MTTPASERRWDVADGKVLYAAVAMVDETVEVALAPPEGHLQSVQGEAGAQMGGGLPADDEAAVGIDDEGHVDEARPGAHEGQVGQPEAVPILCREVAADEVGRPGRLRIGDRRAPLLAAHRALEAQRVHEELDRAAGDRDALAVQLPPDFTGAVDAVVLPVDTADLAG